jgi:hypothetical protein
MTDVGGRVGEKNDVRDGHEEGTDPHADDAPQALNPGYTPRLGTPGNCEVSKKIKEYTSTKDINIYCGRFAAKKASTCPPLRDPKSEPFVNP